MSHPVNTNLIEDMIDIVEEKRGRAMDLSELLKEGRIEEFVLRSAGYRIDAKPLCAMCGDELRTCEIGNGICDTCKDLGSRL